MCGIAGVLRFQGESRDAEVVQGMLDVLARRGPDDGGVATSGIATFGHRRLAILDRTSAAHQPMSGPGGVLLLTYNGELYNYREIRQELGLCPETLRSASDTEIVLHAWHRWGPEALHRFAGQWAFALYDADSQRTWLVRDRFGEKPLYWHASQDRLVFASSIGALVRAPGVPRQLDDRSIVEFLTLRYVVSPRTVLKDIRKVAPGGLVEVSPDGSIREVQWYSPRFRGTRSGRRRSPGETAEVFGTLLGQACRRCMVSDVEVGLLLSDGIDSNGIRAALAENQLEPTAFTFRVGGPGAGAGPEIPTGRGGPIVDVLASPEERWSVLDGALASLTEPVGDGASLATWFLLRRAREFATVFLCGHGGDEILGGYRLSKDRFRLEAIRRLSWAGAGVIGGASARYLNGEGSPERRSTRMRGLPVNQAPAAALYLVDRPLPVAEVDQLLDGRWPEDEHYLQTIERLYGECHSDAGDLDRIQEVLIRTFLSANILSFADGVSMDHSVELRMPFLDRDLAEFVFDLSPGERVSPWPGRANTKLPLRRWARTRLPAEIVDRRKRGFQSGNISELLKHDGEGLRSRILGAGALRRAVPGVERWLGRFEGSNGGPWGGTIWALLVLGVWCDALDVA